MALSAVSSKAARDRAPRRPRPRRASSSSGIAAVEQRLGDGAVEQPGVEMAQAVMRGEPLAERALAGGGRPSMAMIMRSPRRGRASSAMKTGKLVAINAASSTPHRLVASPAP